MYIVTFYSFKGGVGRSMALANVACELVNRNKSVLVVDFDLEAPGLNTFDFGGQKEIKGGIVDFVEKFLETNKAPSVSDHIVKYDRNRKLWLMPAGSNDGNYSRRLSRINWRELYESRSGYFLIEELKAQWNDIINPDYVLVDSRTGHSDVSGICTRQLPNAVVFLFFPNEQNLLGLRRVVTSVEKENSTRKGSRDLIDMHFVTSNVPDLDDEDRILADRLVSFSKELHYKELTTTIHRYNSLALLNQEIFTLSRPKTRLAQEYRDLTDKIVVKNIEDRDGAVAFIEKIVSTYPQVDAGIPYSTLSTKLDAILAKHPRDSKILLLVSQLKERSGDYEEALLLLNKAEDFKGKKLRQARLLSYTGEKEQALKEIQSALSNRDLGYSDVRLALNLLNRLGIEDLELLSQSPALLNLEIADFMWLAKKYFGKSRSDLPLCREMIQGYIKMHNLDIFSKENASIRVELGIVEVGMGEFESAKFLFSKTKPSLKDDIGTIFNYAIADWGETKKPSIELFELVLSKLSEVDFSEMSPNFRQCISLSYFVVGDKKQAKDILAQAESQARELTHSLNFSCWSYLSLDKEHFLNDINLMKQFYKGEKVKPLFLN